MNSEDYIFLDIECCDGNHICSVGYVICDEKFNVIEKKDILINPEKRFKLARAGFDSKIHLAYKPEEFQDKPSFKQMYSTIRKLLNNKVIIGHSIMGDIGYLKNACTRYKLKPFNNKSFCTQLFFMRTKKERHVKSLVKIIDELGIDGTEFTLHKSCDDAHLSMLVMKELCKETNQTLEEILRAKFSDRNNILSSNKK